MTTGHKSEINAFLAKLRRGDATAAGMLADFLEEHDLPMKGAVREAWDRYQRRTTYYGARDWSRTRWTLWEANLYALNSPRGPRLCSRERRATENLFGKFGESPLQSETGGITIPLSDAVNSTDRHTRGDDMSDPRTLRQKQENLSQLGMEYLRRAAQAEDYRMSESDRAKWRKSADECREAYNRDQRAMLAAHPELNREDIPF